MKTAVSITLAFVILVCRQSHEDCYQYRHCVCDFSVKTEPWKLLSASSLCLWFQCTDRASRTAVGISSRCFFFFFGVKREPWGLLSVSSLCLRFLCKDGTTMIAYYCTGLWFLCSERAIKTAVGIVLVFVGFQCADRAMWNTVSIVLVCDLSVQTEQWGLLSV